jgi:hemoglobin-like flavoprotein
MNIQDSLERILRRQDIVADLFYTIFLDRYPQVQQYFRSVDLKRQAVLLTIALKVVEQHYLGGYPVTRSYLEYLGTKHRNLGIPKDTYPMFQDALLATLERFHGDLWSAELAQQWRDALDKATGVMFEGYEHRFHV